MENISMTCCACKVPSVQTLTLDRTMPELDRLIANFVCETCLFPSSLDDLLVRLTDVEFDTATDDPIIVTDIVDDVPPTDEKRITRNVESRDCSKVRLPELFHRGIIRANDRVECLRHTAHVENRTHVRTTNGLLVTWNAFAQNATGHKAVNIYKHVLVNGYLLESLRGLSERPKGM